MLAFPVGCNITNPHTTPPSTSNLSHLPTSTFVRELQPPGTSDRARQSQDVIGPLHPPTRSLSSSFFLRASLSIVLSLPQNSIPSPHYIRQKRTTTGSSASSHPHPSPNLTLQGQMSQNLTISHQNKRPLSSPFSHRSTRIIYS